MIYSHVYQKFYPFLPSTNVATFEEKDRELLIKCLHKFPSLFAAWLIEVLHGANPKNLGDFQFGSDIAKVKEIYFSVADKIMAGQSLSEEEIIAINMALCANKYTGVLSFIISPRSHIARVYSVLQRSDERDKNHSVAHFTEDRSTNSVGENATQADTVMDFSHIKMFEVEHQTGPYITEEVVLFNIIRISQEEAADYVEAGRYNDNVLVLPKKQWISLFRNGKE